ncbi:predicted protein, partial [Naegleria gruberi]
MLSQDYTQHTTQTTQVNNNTQTIMDFEFTSDDDDEDVSEVPELNDDEDVQSDCSDESTDKISAEEAEVMRGIDLFQLQINDKPFELTDKLPPIPNEEEGSLKFTFTTEEVTPLSMFSKIFTPEIEKYLLKQMNERRRHRIEARSEKGKRGRPLTKNDQKSRDNYLKRFNKPFKKKDFKTFLCLLFKLGNGEKRTKIVDCWRMPTVDATGDGLFFKSRMKYHKFAEMAACLKFDFDVVESFFNKNSKEVYQPGTVLAFDESMVGMMMRNNPHHVFMPKKPEKNGCKLYTIADKNGFLVYAQLMKRTMEEPEDPAIAQSKRKKFVRGAPISKETVPQL